MKLKNILYILLIIPFLAACIEDGVTTSSGDRPVFSVDTLDMGVVYSAEGSPTASFKVFNPHKKSIVISNISVSDDSDNLIRLNVDGLAGKSFKDIEIRGGDSIFVFVEATYPYLDLDSPVKYTHHISFLTNGTTQSLPVTATAIDAVRLEGTVLSDNTSFNSRRPYIIYDSLYVAPGVTLILEAGTRLRFHDGASFIVDGTVKALGAPGREVELTGDRMGAVAGRIDYEIMSGQWEGVYFSSSSSANRLEYTSIRNTKRGVIVDSTPFDEVTPSLSLLNCQLRNSREYVLAAYNSSIVASGCELTDASQGVVALEGGNGLFNNCTIANYYLFSALGGPSVQFSPDASSGNVILPVATFNNCILYGNGNCISDIKYEESEIYFNHCLFKPAGSNDEHFIDCLWNTDPLYYTIREDYHFDYRLQPASPAIGHASAELMPVDLICDRYGKPFLNTLGAYGPDVN